MQVGNHVHLADTITLVTGLCNTGNQGRPCPVGRWRHL